MRLLDISMQHTFALFACVALTSAAVICLDDSSLDKTHALAEKVNERQQKAIALPDKYETTEFGDDDYNHTVLGVAINASQHGQSQVTQFLQTVQDTLEKAKPWVVEIEKEAKRLEETAKRFGEGVIRGLGSFVDRLIGGGHVSGSINDEVTTTTSPADDKTPNSHPASTTTATDTVAEVRPVVTTTGAVGAADTAANVAAINDADNEISGQQDDDNTLCPDGFVADANGICLRNHK